MTAQTRAKAQANANANANIKDQHTATAAAEDKLDSCDREWTEMGTGQGTDGGHSGFVNSFKRRHPQLPSPRKSPQLRGDYSFKRADEPTEGITQEEVRSMRRLRFLSRQQAEEQCKLVKLQQHRCMMIRLKQQHQLNDKQLIELLNQYKVLLSLEQGQGIGLNRELEYFTADLSTTSTT